MKTINFNTEAILTICNRYHVKRLRVFGSVARGEVKGESDVDLLVTFSKHIRHAILKIEGYIKQVSITSFKKDILVQE